MKVTDKANLDSVSGLNRNAERTRTERAVGDKKDISSDLNSAKVKLSERAQDMRKIRDVVDSTPGASEARLEELRKMIAKGEYNTNPKAIAEKMVDEFAYSDLLTKSNDE